MFREKELNKNIRGKLPFERVGQALITLLLSFSLPSDIRFISPRRAATAFAFARR